MERTSFVAVITVGLALGMMAPAAAQQDQQQDSMETFDMRAECTLISPESRQQQEGQQPMMVCQYYPVGDDEQQDRGPIDRLMDWFRGLGNQTLQNQTR